MVLLAVTIAIVNTILNSIENLSRPKRKSREAERKGRNWIKYVTTLKAISTFGEGRSVNQIARFRPVLPPIFPPNLTSFGHLSDHNQGICFLEGPRGKLGKLRNIWKSFYFDGAMDD